MNYGLVLDSMIVVLLGATIVYAIILNKRLQSLRNNRAELEQAARAFAEAAYRADESIRSLRSASDGAGAELREQIHRAQSLRDELKFLVEAGEGLADRLEVAASTAVEGRNDGRGKRPGSSAGARTGATETTNQSRDQSGSRSGAQGRGSSSGPTNGANGGGSNAGRPGSGGQVTPLRARASPSPGAPSDDEAPKTRGRGDVDLLKAIENMR
ncbi:DUF6468 domain-containing protein [Fodinicurvata sp. EGI_FJ10296]|uniref:DUF6468 domain-containing protein n=1 Tax=Fodinicurvata sp. EGI_FJ10296 TaxID=3231908 RepID=UPI003452F6CC